MPINPLDLTGKRYLITGAASGIGKETAELLSKLGADLILVDCNEAGLEDTKRICEGVQCTCLTLNLVESSSIKSEIERVCKSVGKIDGLAHIAGIPYICPLKMVDEKKAELLYRVNQYAAIELTKAFQLKKVHNDAGGSIVLISSVYGVVGSAANVGYAMTKAAIIGITKALAIELAPKHIRVNCIAPGFIHTKMMDENKSRFDDDYMLHLDGLHPLGLGEARDIANSIIFLLSNMSRWITGATFNVDGGFTAQ